ncbi:cyclic nucleotide-binding domain-containing protein [Bradyrhizobium sp. CW1]|uniref:Crp/Fnr family transcriptional regulator n=1 Tax=Bradyrhizobium sp. CW1 TaxID=2782686 RepID=UPI00320A384D
MVSSFNSSTNNPIIRKLQAVLSLSDEERAAILALPLDQREVRARQEIVREGDRPTRSFVILEGVACAFKLTGEAKRQILAFHIAGDMPDCRACIWRRWTSALPPFQLAGSASFSTQRCVIYASATLGSRRRFGAKRWFTHRYSESG